MYGFVLMALLSGCGRAYSEQRQLDEVYEAIALVNGEPIAVATFKEAYVDYLLKTGLQDESGHRRNVLDSQIDAQLLVQKARAEGIEQEERYTAAMHRIERKLLVDVYVSEQIYGSIQITEDDLKDMFVRSNTTLTVRHLYARTKEQADQLYERVLAGSSFEELAREVFADPVLAENGGLIGDITVDDMDIAFETIAFQLEVGEVSPPVKTAQGYSIIKLEDRFVKPLITETEFAERRDRMEHFVTYRKKVAARKVHLGALIEELAPQFDSASFDRLFAHIAGIPVPEQVEEVQAWMDLPLVTFGKGGEETVWTVRELLNVASETSEQQRARVDRPEALADFIHGLVARDEMARRSRKMGLDTSPKFVLERKEAIDGWIWDQALTAVTGAQVIPEDSLRAYYERYQDEFVSEPEVRVWEILLDTKKEAVDLLDRLRNESFENLAQAHSLRGRADETNGELGYLTRKQLGLLADDVFAAREGDVLGPIEVKGHYVLLKVGERRGGKLQSFEEARPEIDQQLRFTYKKALFQEEIDILRSQSIIQVKEEMLLGLALK